MAALARSVAFSEREPAGTLAGTFILAAHRPIVLM